MERLKLLLSNFLVYGFGGIISKIIPLIMLPIVTRLMPDTTYFGLNDIFSVVVSFGTSLAVMGMYDAMFRMFFEKEERKYKEDICSTAFVFTLATSTAIFCIMIAFRGVFSELFFSSREYTNLVALSAISILIGGTNSIVSAPTRMNNQRNIYLFTNTISPIISYAVSIPLLLKGWYIIALPLAGVLSAISMEIIFICLNRKWFSFKRFKMLYLKQMLKIAIPLVPNFLIYWIFNSSDRIMISKMLGNDMSGVYAIGAKLGQVSQLIYTAFAGGWQYFAFSTMKDADQVQMTSNIFEYLGLITLMASSVMTLICKGLFQLLFEGEYVMGYVVVPYLFMAPLLLMLFQVACNQFLIIKKTWPNILILSLGAISNVVLNYICIPVIGIEGAALGTLVGYIISIIVVVLVLQNMRLIKISFRFWICLVCTVGYILLWSNWLKDYFVHSLMLFVCLFFLYSGLYGKQIFREINKLRKRSN